MINHAQRRIKWQHSKLLSLTIQLVLLLTVLPWTHFVNAQDRLARVPLRSLHSAGSVQEPCSDTDQSERCGLRRAVSAALDEIENLRKQLKAASEAVTAQEAAIKAANEAIAAGAKEREAYENTIKIADRAIAQQSQIISSYERAIATLQTMVDMALKRVDTLEAKVDRANARAAKLGLVLTIAGIIGAVVLKR